MSPPAHWPATWRRGFTAAELDCPLFAEGGISIQHEPLGLRPHAHPGWELHVIASGTMITALDDGSQLKASGGDLVITAPGVRHRGLHDIIPPSKLLWLVLGPLHSAQAQGSALLAADLARLERGLREAGNRVIRAPDLIVHQRSITRLLREGPLHAGGDLAARLRAALSTFVLAAAGHLYTSSHPSASPLTLAARAWLAEHLDQPITVPELARSYGLSASRFHQVFLVETGETPAACHLRLRITAAAQRLRDHPQLSIGAIAKDLGFSDQRYFATCFKRLSGMTPSEYRAIAHRGSGRTLAAAQLA